MNHNYSYRLVLFSMFISCVDTYLAAMSSRALEVEERIYRARFVSTGGKLVDLYLNETDYASADQKSLILVKRPNALSKKQSGLDFTRYEIDGELASNVVIGRMLEADAGYKGRADSIFDRVLSSLGGKKVEESAGFDKSVGFSEVLKQSIWQKAGSRVCSLFHNRK